MANKKRQRKSPKHRQRGRKTRDRTTATPPPTQPTQPAETTGALPGSAEKIAIMTARIAARQPACVRGDAIHSEKTTQGILGTWSRNGRPMGTGKVVDLPGITPERLMEDTAVIAQSFATRLLILRKRAGMSQRKLAETCGIPRTTLRGYESNFEPPLSVATKIADALGVSVAVLAGQRSVQ